MNSKPRTLRLRFHGRILYHFGIQMYQIPVAAVAELISNAWDADAENVSVVLPENIDQSSVIVIKDDGTTRDGVITDKLERLASGGMFAMDWPTLFREAFAGCQDFFHAILGRAPEDERLKALAVM
jgi:hypothetical protein